MQITDWKNCYEGGWKDAICAEAFSHPAKFSRSLIVRIIRHGLDQGYWKPGDLLGDPFGGVALGGIIAGYHGLNWIGVELEPRFVELGNKNLAMHGPRWLALGEACCVKLVQGDSRRFAEIVGEVGGVVSSPPFATAQQGGGICHTGTPAMQGTGGGHSGTGGYRMDAQGQTPGQIGSLPAGQLDAAITSPPYADSDTQPTKMGSGKGTRTDGDSAGRNKGDYHYGDSEGQIGALKSGSLDGAVTSPPWENQEPSHAQGSTFVIPHDKGGCNFRDVEYGSSEGQVGNTSGETYWQAMRQVYSQMFLALKPSGICAIVVKDYVKDKARVPLCDQTCTLLDALGFSVFERCRCWLVKRDEHPGLFGEPIVKTKERKSFFRRLAEKKGSPRIDWEEVIWCRTPPRQNPHACPQCGETMLLGDCGYVCGNNCEGKIVAGGGKRKGDIAHERGWLGKFEDGVKGIGK